MKLIVRADATARVGAGHAMRCATLIDAWRRAGLGAAALAGRVELPFVAARLLCLGVPVQDRVTDAADAMLVVDTYDAAERAALGTIPAACRVLVDDLGGTVPAGYSAVWHPHAVDGTPLYPAFGGLVIGGPGSLAIREGLPQWHADAAGSAVFVTLGGSGVPDPVVAILSDVRASMPGVPFIGAGDWTPSTWARIDASDLWERAIRCSCLVTAAGTTVWEAAAVGIPAVVVQIAENQSRVAAWAESSGVPVVRLCGAGSPGTVSTLTAMLSRARPLPRLANGASNVAVALARLAHAA